MDMRLHPAARVALILTALTPFAPCQAQQPEPPAVAAPASPQSNQADSNPPPAPSTAETRPGLVEGIAKFLGDSATTLKEKSQQTIESLGAGAKSAGENLPQVSPPRIITGRAGCPATAHGGPDCQLAVLFLCRSNGLLEGKSLDIETAQVCNAKALMAGAGSACRTDHFVTKALCQ